MLEFISNFFLINNHETELIEVEFNEYIESINDDLLVLDISDATTIDVFMQSLSNKFQILKAKSDIVSHNIINTIGYAYVMENKTILIIFDDIIRLRKYLNSFLEQYAGATSYKTDIDDILDMNLISINSD